jgi:hypothetical protein
MTATPEQLQQQVASIDRDLAQVETDYAQLIEKLAAGDRTVLAKTEALELRRSVLVRNKAATICAAGVLAKQLEAEAAAAAAAELRKQILAAKALATEIADIHTALDTQLTALRQALETRATLLRQLGNSPGIDNSAWLAKLIGKQVANRAFAAAGLHAFVNIETPAPGSFAGFSASNTVLLAIGKDVVADETDNGTARRRLNGE